MTSSQPGKLRDSAVPIGGSDVLLVDSGNSRIKWARWGAVGMGAQQAVSRSEAGQATVFDVGSDPVCRVLIANVAGAEAAGTLAAHLRDACGVDPEFVSVASEAFGLRIAYADPGKLGVDRWVAMIGARSLGPGAVCVVDAGTAMTIDAVDAGGRHLGGLITPGPDLMIGSLLEHTADLAAFFQKGVETRDLLADNTRGAIVQGSVHALAALVDRCMQQLTADKSMAPRLVITGGAADRIVPFVSSPLVRVPDLVLRGLAVMARD
ncbi:MAG TPA: type III pantothenate kinase [Steroidobacteraceae bacterium]|nr:type III pantothenate kinase [Steroidobacteraceae bacterium]